jgi:hypothetical protein
MPGNAIGIPLDRFQANRIATIDRRALISTACEAHYQ